MSATDRLGALAVAMLAAGALGLAWLPTTPALAAEPDAVAYRSAGAVETATPIKHLIVVMQQNHTFDNYFGTYPSADGHPPETCLPVDPVEAAGENCVKPFHLGDRTIADLNHSRSTFLNQFNDGRMDGFVWALNELRQDGSISMGYYDDRDIPYYWNLADEYVLFDRLFSSARAGSLWNRMFWVAGVPGGDSTRIPHEGFDMPTIFDRLHERGIPWKFYVRGYDPELTYRLLPDLQVLAPQIPWVPLVNFPRFLDDPERASRIVDLDDFFRDLREGTLPAVSYVVALGATEHPLTSLEVGQRVVRSMVHALKESDAWSSSALLLTYDDWGGWYDHVAPPQVDEYGYGFRVPGVLVSPYAPRGHIDSTTYDFTSILRFIQENWGVETLAERDATANSIGRAFDFNQAPRPPRLLPFSRLESGSLTARPQAAIYASYSAGLVFALGVLFVAALRRRRRA